MSGRRAMRAWIALTLGTVLTLSCSSYDGFELRAETEAPALVTVDAHSVILPQGVAVGMRVQAPGAQNPETGELYVDIRSSDPSVINVWPTVEQSTFVVYGVSEGTAVLTIAFENEDDESVPVKVTGPTATMQDAGSAGSAGAGTRYNTEP